VAGVTFTGPNGSDPVAAIRQLKTAVLPAESDVRAALDGQRERIIRRTSDGTDAQGARFAPYSEKYARRKGAHAVDLGGRGGRILDNIEPVTARLDSEHEIALSITDETDAMIARVHNEGATIRTRLGQGGRKPKKNGNATFQMPARRFFDANPEDLRDMEDDIGSRIEARLTQA